MAALIVTCGLVASFAFTSKPFSTQMYKYNRTANVIAASGTNHIINTELDVTSSWTSQLSVLPHEQTNVLQEITFESADFTLQAAVTAVRAYFDGHSSTLPNDGLSFTAANGKSITVYRESSE